MAILSSSTIYGSLNVSDNITSMGLITGSKIYNAVYNDYAELFEKDDINENYKDCHIICINPNTGKYTYSTEKNSNMVVGVVSDSYGHIIGGEETSIDENLKKYIPIGLAGRVNVYIKGKTRVGDLITSSEIKGVGQVSSIFKQGTIIGKALEKKTTEEIGKVKILIMNC